MASTTRATAPVVAARSSSQRRSRAFPGALWVGGRAPALVLGLVIGVAGDDGAGHPDAWDPGGRGLRLEFELYRCRRSRPGRCLRGRPGLGCGVPVGRPR